MELNYDVIAREVLTLKETGDKSFWVTLSPKYGKSSDALRSWFERERRKRNAMETLLEEEVKVEDDMDDTSFHGESESENLKYRASFSSKTDAKTGEKYFSSDRLVKMNEEDLKDEAFVLRAHGFDPNKWIVVSAINNFWQGMRTKDQGSATLYQSKITVRPKGQANSITFEDINHFFNNFDSKYLYPLSQNRTLVATHKSDYHNKTLVVPITDPHFGNEEENYSTEDKIKKLLSGILLKLSIRPVNKILVVALGDVLHVDTEGGTTTSGTQVGERGMIYTHWEKALVSLIGFLSELSLHAPVEYVSVSGNHDRVTGFTLSKALEYALIKSSSDVSFDTSFSHRKYKTIGKSIFGFAHGDMPSKNQGHVLQGEEREAFGNSKYAYLLMGHLHHISIKDENNVVLMTLPSVTGEDYWHTQNGYVGSWKGTLCYVVDDDNGIEETWHMGA